MTTDELPVPRAPVAPPRSRRPRNLLLIVAGFVVMLSVITGGAFVYFYDRATAIDRSNPQVVTEQFLDAALVLQDPNSISLYVCDNWSAADAIAAVAPPPGEVVATWGDSVVHQVGRSATVTLTIQFSVAAGTGIVRDQQSWTLGLEDEDGWRVCGLTRNGSLNP